jgi:hypothetical protein
MSRVAICLAGLAGCAGGEVSGVPAGYDDGLPLDCAPPAVFCGNRCLAPCEIENEVIDPVTCGCVCDVGYERRAAECVPAPDEGTDADADTDADSGADTDSDVATDAASDTGTDSGVDEGLYCAGCASNADCGGGANFCLSIVGGDGSKFCGTDCSAGQACPADAACISVQDGAGVELGRNCAPADGSC